MARIPRPRLREKCNDAARTRRALERVEFMELSRLLPLPANLRDDLDKGSVIRLAITYLRLRNVFPNGLGRNWDRTSGFHEPTPVIRRQLQPLWHQLMGVDSTTHREGPPSPVWSSFAPLLNLNGDSGGCEPTSTCQRPAYANRVEPDIGSMLLQTLDGFVFVLDDLARIIYISETASTHLGLAQIELTGTSIFDYLQESSHNELASTFELSDADLERLDEQARDEIMDDHEHEKQVFAELKRDFTIWMRCVLPKRNAGLITSGYKAIYCTGYLKLRLSAPKCRTLQSPFYYIKEKLSLLEKNEELIVTSVPDSTKFKRAKASSFVALKRASRAYPALTWESYALVAHGHSLLPSGGLCEIRLTSRDSFMARTSASLQILDIESQGYAQLGFALQDLLRQTLYQLIHPSDLTKFSEYHSSLLERGQIVSQQPFRLLKREGAALWCHFRATYPKANQTHWSTFKDSQQKKSKSKSCPRQIIFAFSMIGSDEDSWGHALALPKQTSDPLKVKSEVELNDADKSAGVAKRAKLNANNMMHQQAIKYCKNKKKIRRTIQGSCTRKNLNGMDASSCETHIAQLAQESSTSSTTPSSSESSYGDCVQTNLQWPSQRHHQQHHQNQTSSPIVFESQPISALADSTSSLVDSDLYGANLVEASSSTDLYYYSMPDAITTTAAPTTVAPRATIITTYELPRVPVLSNQQASYYHNDSSNNSNINTTNDNHSSDNEHHDANYDTASQNHIITRHQHDDFIAPCRDLTASTNYPTLTHLLKDNNSLINFNNNNNNNNNNNYNNNLIHSDPHNIHSYNNHNNYDNNDHHHNQAYSAYPDNLIIYQQAHHYHHHHHHQMSETSVGISHQTMSSH